MAKYVVSDHWGHLQQLEEFWEPKMAVDPAGTPYIADTHGYRALRLRCACGHEFTIPKRDFPGRRKLKSCGRPQCKYADKPKVKRNALQRGMSLSVYLSKDVVDWLLTQAAADDLSLSKLLENLIRGLMADRFIDQ